VKNDEYVKELYVVWYMVEFGKASAFKTQIADIF
jgi:hypothetical protein